MSLKVLIDVSLSPRWLDVFKSHGLYAVHWSAVGDLQATDKVIMEWARENNHVVFTHDLDFGTLLAVTKAEGPSVIQVRTQDVLPSRLGPTIVNSIWKYETLLRSGALIVIDERQSRIRILPLMET